MTIKHSILPVKTTVKELAGLRPDDIPIQVLGSTEPLLLKGIVDQWQDMAKGRSLGQEDVNQMLDSIKTREDPIFALQVGV